MCDTINWETITIHSLHDISRSKGYETIKFGQLLIKNNMRNIFFKYHAENELRRFDLFVFFKKSFILGESKWSTL